MTAGSIKRSFSSIEPPSRTLPLVSFKAPEMLYVNDTRVVRGLFGIDGIKVLVCLLDFICHLRYKTLIDKEVVL
jgi:hypothetical protein